MKTKILDPDGEFDEELENKQAYVIRYSDGSEYVALFLKCGYLANSFGAFLVIHVIKETTNTFEEMALTWFDATDEDVEVVGRFERAVSLDFSD